MKQSLIILFVFVFSISFASDKNADFKRVYYHKGHTTPMLMVLKDHLNISKLEAKSYLKSKLNLKGNEDLILIASETDKNGYEYLKYQQVVDDVKVFGGEFKAHLKNGMVTKYTGHYYNNISEGIASITKNQSLTQALNYFNAQKYMWEDTKEEALLKRAKHNQNLSYYPSPELMYYNTNNLSTPNFELVYEMEIYAKKPLRKEKVFVSAITGEIVNTINQLHDVSVPARAISRFSDTVSIITEEVTLGNYTLDDRTRGGGIETYDLNEETVYNLAVNFTNDSTFWDLRNSEKDEVAIDAHWGAEMTYDYFFQNHGRNSYDNAGATLLSYVHYASNFDNAFWDGVRMTYGDGGGGFEPLVSLDIVGHEIAHGVTENSADLIYQGESGALNESFSDIFGNSIEHFIDSTRASWELGEQIQSVLRDMSNPKSYDNPNTYKGDFWINTADPFDNGGVHFNSGVQNYWYYLLVEGGTGINDNGDTYNVSSMGWKIASEIAYRNLSVYLTTTSDYEDAGVFAVEAADDMFGMCSSESENVNEAWYAVGVSYRLSEDIEVDFSVNRDYVCALPEAIEFNNLTKKGTHYVWDFDDGNTDTTLNPAHTYTNEGTYNVSLTGYKEGCYLDTSTITKNIDVIELGSPIPAICTPNVQLNLKSVGIDNVEFNTLNNKTGFEDGDYIDYTCETNTILHIDSTYELFIRTSPSSRENVRVWVDFNRDGNFDNGELIFTDDEVYENHYGSVTFNTFSNLTLYKPLRMRIASDAFFSKTFDACTGIVNGQIEDYSIVLTDDLNTTLSTIESTKDNIEIYPNPVTDYLHIEVDEKINSVKLLDFLGKEILKVQSNRIDLSNISKGMYIVKVKTLSNTYTKEIIKK